MWIMTLVPESIILLIIGAGIGTNLSLKSNKIKKDGINLNKELTIWSNIRYETNSLLYVLCMYKIIPLYMA